ncbi:hypothetical protein KEM54_000339 [Ascosphaera aggregata]|nr:hypothetical protein KEM54_000339 [Ascosphaera aggregata]
MTGLEELSPAHLVLLAVQQCLRGGLTALLYLRSRSPRVLTTELCYRIILTFLPETVHPTGYVSIVERLARGDCESVGEAPVDIDLAAIEVFSVSQATEQVNRLHLLPLQKPGFQVNDEQKEKEKGEVKQQSLLIDFLIHRAHRIDSEVGLQPFILELLNPFLHTSTFLRRWTASTILPLLRLNYDYYSKRTLGGLSLHVLESFDAASATNFFLSSTEKSARGGQVGRDLKGLVGPWICGACENKRRILTKQDENEQVCDMVDDWNEVNEWLLSTSRTDFELAVEAIEQWDGPTDVDFGGYLEEGDLDSTVSKSAELREKYAQAAIACVYATTEMGQAVLFGSTRILTRVAYYILGYSDNLQLFINSPSLRPIPIEEASIPSISRPHLLQNALSHHTNALTLPNHHTLTFLDALLVSVRTLISLGHPMSSRSVADLCLLADESLQISEFKSLLGSIKPERKGKRDWNAIRDMLLWLRDWCCESNRRVPGCGIFWRLEQCYMDKMILESMLLAEQHNLAIQIYANEPRKTTMKFSDVEATVISTILHCYDNATNGNKTRGQMKLASEILQAFVPYFPSSLSLDHIRNLIEATHSLSFYSLALQPGVPFRPVSIRAHQDPLSLIEKVLEQNKKAYVRVQDLIAIGRQLVAAGFPGIGENGERMPTQQQNHDRILTISRSSAEETKERKIAERRITSMAISSALDADDFETANSLIMTRIAPSPAAFKYSSQDEIRCDDDISWRAIYKVGTYRSPSIIDAPLYKQIHRLSQRMELLSLALLLVSSPKNLNEILAAWRRCDEEVRVLRRRESQEEEDWACRGDRMRMTGETERASNNSGIVSGTFTPLARLRQRNDEEDAPMGLFDVARGAARAFKKNAFPLRVKKDIVTTPHAAASPTSAGRSGVSTPLPDRPRNSGDFSLMEMPSGTGDQAKRQRKRDMVSNMVTGGLASGLGWVLGAQPVLRQENTAETEHQKERMEGNEMYDELGRKIRSTGDSPGRSAQIAFVGHTEVQEGVGNDREPTWDEVNHQPVLENRKANITAAARHTNVEDVDDAWETNWGNDEDETTEAVAPLNEHHQAAAVSAATTSNPHASHIKEDGEVGEDWEANWGWD